MNEQIDEAIDQVDAAVFSSDWLSDPKERQKLKEHAESWLREIVRWDELDAESGESSGEDELKVGDKVIVDCKEIGWCHNRKSIVTRVDGIDSIFAEVTEDCAAIGMVGGPFKRSHLRRVID
jgi:hypothetical protein